MRTDRGKTPLARRHGDWLSLTVAVTLLPHVQYLPPWLIALCAVLVMWRLASDRGLTALPARLPLLLVATVVVVGSAIEYRHLLGKDPGLALLAGLAGLKLLESRTVRDGRALILLGFFLQMGQFLNGQEIWVAVLTLAGSLLAVATLMTLEVDGSARSALRTASTLLLQAAPFMLLLFVLFPRIQGPLWGLPADAFSSLTGLSESMTPGSISSLIRSGKIAFRAQFTSDPPPPRLLYWRGPVLSRFDGTTWRPGHASVSGTPPYRVSGPAHEYAMTLEAHDQHWLLALDFAGGPVPNAVFASDFRLLSITPVRARMRQQLRAYPETRVGLDERPRDLAANLHLPAGSNPRLQAFGQQIAAQNAAPARRVDALVAAFRSRDLKYTLSPGRLGQHAADEFFFDTRQGFCEHFSSSFAIAARAAGLPTRVVTGYQGGERNPLDGSLVVRQSDAHAWVEIWLDGRGWVRVDPTAAANPQRIDDGIAGALPDPDLLPLFMQPQLSWLRNLRYRWEATSNAWNQWVLGYNSERQRSFLGSLGFSALEWKHLIVKLTVVVGLLMLAFLAWALIKTRPQDALDRIWQRFCQRLARSGTQRPAWQGPLEFARRAAERHPEQAETILNIAARYARLRYGPSKASARELRALKDLIKRFRPQ